MTQVEAPVRKNLSRGVATFDGGDMARLIAQKDWSDSPVGQPADWPQSLKTTVGLILPAAAQIVLFWGPEFVAIYNDAYAPTIGDKHPRALGRPAEESWTELWDDLRPLLQSVRDTGQTVFAKDRPFYIERHDYPETVYFDISFSAVPDECGKVGGVLCIVSETTERVLGEQRSFADRERLTKMFEQAPTFMALMTGPDHIFQIANPSYRQLVGNRDVIGKKVREALPDIADQGFFELLDQVYASGEAYVGRGISVWIERGPGSREERFVDFVYHPITDDGGAVTGILVQGSDVTERNRAEAQLRESEERLRLAVENAEVGFWDVEEGHGNLTWPDLTKSMFGISPDVPVTMDDFYAGLHPDDLPRVAAAYSAAADPAVRALYDVEYRTIGKEDGIVRWVAAKGRGMFEGEGADARCLRVIGTIIDISDSKQTEEALREKTSNLEILNRTGSAIAAELDLERVVQLVTDAGVELTGAQFGAFFYNVVDRSGESYMLYTLSGVPRSAFENFPMPRNTKIFAPTFDGDGIVRSDDITKDPRYGQNPPYHGKPEGHLPVTSYLAVPVTGRSGEVIGGLFFGHEEVGRFKPHHEQLMEGIAAQAAVAIDNARLYGNAQHEIEQRMRAEQALTALNETLESRVMEEIERRAKAEEVLRQTQKMETVGQLSGGIAHDFNNLLQIIHGNLSLLERAEAPGNDRWRRAVANALTGTQRAAALTQRLLAFSRRQPLDAKPVDVNRLIGDMSEMLHRTLGETVVVETHLVGGLPSALVDGNQLENAILNLAINARDAMPRGGRLAISTGVAEFDRAYADLHPDATPGKYVRIAVADTGEGMSKDVLERALEPFFSTKEVGQGTGLGLPMVYGFVRQSGGHIVLDSREGEGTTVELFLPQSQATAQSRTVKAADEELPRGHGERILLCEDDQGVRLFSSETLRDLGYEVIEAHDAAEAVHLMRERGPVDLLFTDVVLPGGQTGADLAREARAIQRDLKVLFTTGYARSALDKEASGEKGIELLLKPFGIDELATRIRQILG